MSHADMTSPGVSAAAPIARETTTTPAEGKRERLDERYAPDIIRRVPSMPAITNESADSTTPSERTAGSLSAEDANKTLPAASAASSSPITTGAFHEG
jgi:hypothetical protein